MLVQQVEKEGGDVSEFLESKNSLGRSALHIAAFHGHSSVIAFLITKGTNIEVTDISNSTPLHLCASSGHDPTSLIQKGANPGAVSQRGYYVIHAAAAGGSVQCLETILDLRPEDINAQTEEGDTPLHVAVRCGHSEIVSSLLTHNTEALDAMNYSGAAPLHLAALHGRPSILTLLLDNLATRNLNMQDHQGRVALHFAAMSNQKECAAILLRRGVHPSPTDADGRTPLHLAAARGQKMLVGLLLSQPGIEPNALDKEEGTPLAYAQANGHFDCIELLQIHAKPLPVS